MPQVKSDRKSMLQRRQPAPGTRKGILASGRELTVVLGPHEPVGKGIGAGSIERTHLGFQLGNQSRSAVWPLPPKTIIQETCALWPCGTPMPRAPCLAGSH